MVIEHHVSGYEDFKKFMADFDSDGKNIHVYFTGTKLPSGNSWCEDCQRAYPVLQEALVSTKTSSHLIYVEVGDRPIWKDINNSFRKDPETNLLVIPTLIRWKGPQKLEGYQCEKKELVEMLLTDDED
ncbi:thioredoxin domain-containing protein 17-like [Agrilus planipennis]|uniref:Thioredoxin domain-containing protein 17 n=1 Tax=Agrilus planipennis TaxID=224129 RepID=A0A1W4WB29_AGRPL|nr:thioredoxin domain-containing protein 17-like [Agrilus planipennis]